MNKYDIANSGNISGVVVIGSTTGNIVNQVQSPFAQSIDWDSLKNECKTLISKSPDEEVRSLAFEVNENLRSKNSDNIIPHIKKMGKKGLEIAESLGCSVISGLITTLILQK